MPRKRKCGPGETLGLNMTAMIDVVFLLIVYFICTIAPQDVVAHLDVSRPVMDPMRNKPIPMIRIVVAPDDLLTINGTTVERPALDALLGKLADIETNQTIAIACLAGSRHSSLVGVLDLCAKNRMGNLSVMSAK